MRRKLPYFLGSILAASYLRASTRSRLRCVNRPMQRTVTRAARDSVMGKASDNHPQWSQRATNGRLKDFGLTKSLSSRWQISHGVPEADYRAWLDGLRFVQCREHAGSQE